MTTNHLRLLSATITFATLIFLNACIRGNSTYLELPPGIWRGEINVQGEKLPFNFKVYNTAPGEKPYLEILNGSEVIRVDEIEFLHDGGSMKDDTVIIHFPLYNSFIKANYAQGEMQGTWGFANKPDERMDFKAKHNLTHRFRDIRKTPTNDITGKWEVTFFEEDGSEEKALGEFKQTGNKLEGTFLTTTGDYRFLEGTVQANKMYLSCFDGSHAFYFEATLSPNKDSIVYGGFVAGATYQCAWEAKRNLNFKLEDPYGITKVAKPSGFNFNLPDKDGNSISLSDQRFEGKVKLLQILGTWCPNCGDEGVFLSEIHNKYHSKGVEIIGLAFEKQTEKAKIDKAIDTYKAKYGLKYPILYAGPSNKKDASAKWPQLGEIKAFPTLLVLDKNNNVVKVHTGFSGPATSEYPAFKKEMGEILERLLEN